MGLNAFWVFDNGELFPFRITYVYISTGHRVAVPQRWKGYEESDEIRIENTQELL
ncbi:hypothetical protein [Fodinibius saliphilus]|uniref:hypothetical protein n=1 Tax=Fodinibius saliphilus TaxID=1920650 RepID=UPI001485D250|nr:hypothetical protein [Fodinibius saliphilus]